MVLAAPPAADAEGRTPHPPLWSGRRKKCDGRVLDGVGLWRLLTCPKLHRRRRRGTGEIRWGVQATRKTRGQRDGEGAIPTSDPQPANARPRPALATCDAMCARDPCLRPDLQTAPATRARDVRVRDSRAQSARDPSATIVRRGMVASTERRGRKKTYDLQDPGVRMPIVAPKVYSVLRGTAPRECNGHALLNGAALQTPLEG